jgi:hypothetical protein
VESYVDAERKAAQELRLYLDRIISAEVDRSTL